MFCPIITVDEVIELARCLGMDLPSLAFLKAYLRHCERVGLAVKRSRKQPIPGAHHYIQAKIKQPESWHVSDQVLKVLYGDYFSHKVMDYFSAASRMERANNA